MLSIRTQILESRKAETKDIAEQALRYSRAAILHCDVLDQTDPAVVVERHSLMWGIKDPEWRYRHHEYPCGTVLEPRTKEDFPCKC
jgi:hypothetical protein